MSTLLRLYPRSWRDRYEAEFLGLLEARPPSLSDRFDIVRGAIDARLNLGTPHASDRITRLAAASALAGGSLWVAWLGASIGGFDELDRTPIRDAGVLVSMLMGLALAAGHVTLGLASVDRMLAWGGVAAAIATIGFSISAFGGGGAALFALAGSIALGVAVAGRTLPTLIAALWVAATLGVFVGFAGLVATDWRDPDVMLVAIPYGFSWILIGGTIALRGMPRAAGDAGDAGSDR